MKLKRLQPCCRLLSKSRCELNLGDPRANVLSDGLWALAMTRTLPNPVMKGLAGKLLGRLSERPVSEFTAHNT
ncbi:USP, partial [Symbiodinium natans]